MQRQFYLRAVDLETGDETVTERVWLKRVAEDSAWKWAEEFFGHDDVTWIENVGPDTIHVGRILEDGFRSRPLVTVTVEEVEAEEGDNDTGENEPDSPTSNSNHRRGS